MGVVAYSTSPEAVQAYRFQHAQLGQEFVGEGDPSDLAYRFGQEGPPDVFWTNNHFDEARALCGALLEQGKEVVVDVDDYFDEVTTGNQAHRAWRSQNRKKYHALLDMATRRVASTPFLADRYDCVVAPNFLDTTAWDWPRRERDDDWCVLLHCGSVNRAEDYLEREATFRAYMEQPNTKIVFMGWLPKWAKDYPPGRVIFCRWVEWGKYQRMLRWIAPDLLVSPMVHNDFNLAKSNIKWLEAGAIGACFVGERWGEYERTVTDAATGVLAEGDREWTEKLLELAHDKHLRQEIAAAGTEAVYSRYTWESVGPNWTSAVLGQGG